MTDLPELVRAVSGIRLLVIGDVLLDSYVRCGVTGLAREGPVPVLSADELVHRCGGAANVAANAAALGADVRIISACGADEAGDRLVGQLRDAGVGARGVLRLPTRQTPVKRRYMAGDQLMMRVDSVGGGGLPRSAQLRLRTLLAQEIDAVDAVLVSDNGDGAVSALLVDTLAALRPRRPATVVVDTSRIATLGALRPTAVTPSIEDARHLLGADGVDADGDEGPRSLAEQLLHICDAEFAVLTMGAEGAVAVGRDGQPMRTYGRASQVRSTVGAGDTFAAALALALAAGVDITLALELASAAAAVVVERPGTAVCTTEALTARLGEESKIVPAADLAQWQRARRRDERRLVFANGCFDLLHAGHVSHLRRAKELGDLLVVGVNSDASVRRLKGTDRPLIPLPERLRVLAALSCVDAVVGFEGDSPVDLLTTLRPEVYVKGDDYTPDTLPEWPLVVSLGGRVELLENVPERSTTNLIERIRATATAGHPPGAEGSWR